MIRTIIAWTKREWKQLAMLALAVMIVYFNSLRNAFISDDLAITASISKTSLVSALSSPNVLTRTLLYMGIYHLAGLVPWAFRLANIAFHLINVLLVYGLICILSKRHIAFFAALLFAVHPIAVESVTWISGGVYPQYSALIVLSLISYSIARRKGSSAWYVFSILWCMLAFITSDKAVVLPLLLALYEFSFGHLLRFWKKLLPFFFIDAVFIGLYVHWISPRVAQLQTTFFQNPNPLRNPLLYIPEAIAGYLKLFFWPIPLSLYHVNQTVSMTTIMINSIITCIFFSVVIVAYSRSRILFFFLTFFLISLLPTLLPIQISWTVAERYAYLGSIGIIVAFVIIYSNFTRHSFSILKKSAFSKILRPFIGIGIPIILVTLLSVRTIIRNRDWNNELSFWSATVKTAPNLPNVHSNLAVALGQTKQYDEAIAHFQQAIVLKPDWTDAYFNLAFTYQRSGQYSAAITNYQKSLQLNPKLWQAYRNLAEISFGESKYDDAITYLTKAIRIDATNANLLANIALVYQKTGNITEMRRALDKALQIEPANPYASELLRSITK